MSIKLFENDALVSLLVFNLQIVLRVSFLKLMKTNNISSFAKWRRNVGQLGVKMTEFLPRFDTLCFSIILYNFTYFVSFLFFFNFSSIKKYTTFFLWIEKYICVHGGSQDEKYQCFPNCMCVVQCKLPVNRIEWFIKDNS